MSIDKWLSEEDSSKEKIRREKAFKSLSEGEVKELKKKKIRDIVQKDEKKSKDAPENERILKDVIEFKEWLNQRTYLKGDVDKIEIWIKNLYTSIEYEAERREKSIDGKNRKNLIEDYKTIPPKFLEEKTRIAINKKLHGIKRTNSDNYYLRKLRSVVKEKLNESAYYEILDKILKSF
ncbi:MAG: hypothetical protein ACXAEX_22240 [Promethearchaeota archaeon]|jgi:uncharacterized protein YydD (DUF2326 family)